MKIVREHINEKFTDKSDAVQDMGIGMYQIYKTLKQGDLVRFKKRLDIENSEPPRFYSKGGIIEIDQVTYKKNDDIIIQYRYYPDKTFLRNNSPSRSDIWGWNFDFFKEYFEPFNRKQIYEKFSEDNDAIQDMGIGAVHMYKELFDKFGAADKQQAIYTIAINDDHIDFWFSNIVLREKSKAQLLGLNNYVQKLITKLGYDSILINPEFHQCYFVAYKKTMPSIVRYKLVPAVQHIIKNGEYRREFPEFNVTFVDYGKLNSKYEKDAMQEVSEDS